MKWWRFKKDMDNATVFVEKALEDFDWEITAHAENTRIKLKHCII